MDDHRHHACIAANAALAEVPLPPRATCAGVDRSSLAGHNCSAVALKNRSASPFSSAFAVKQCS